MVRSMTSYARRDSKGKWGNATWELRSVNQRYLEIYIHIPEQFRRLESTIRERLRNRLARGKVECNLYFDASPSTKSVLVFDQSLSKQLLEAAQWIKQQNANNGEIDLVSILKWPGVISIQEKQKFFCAIKVKLLAELELVINDFISTRENEGASLKAIIERRLVNISSEVRKIRSRMPEVLKWQHERLVTKIEEAKLQIDNNRIEQELLMLAQRIDITEELDRLDSHVKETFNVLKKREAIGRRLDFMMQEFNRESNTLASKSINLDITASAIELKILIEQIREQIQNIE